MSSAATDTPERLAAQAQRAYDAGDFATVRRLVAGLLAASDAALSARARALLVRVSVDRQALCVLAFAFVLLCVIVYVYAR